MYKLKWYATGEKLTYKLFPTLSEAIEFSVYKIPFQSFYGIDKVEENA